jgi:hypothetical protein
MRRLLPAFLCVLFAVAVQAQAPAPAPPDPLKIAAQFGPGFHLVAKYPPLTGDLINPGTEDAIVVATAEDPLGGAAAYGYKVVDPFGKYFGWSDPKDTAPFALNVDKPLCLLVVENWRAPARRFVIVNLPFEKLSLSHVPVKKRSVTAIAAEEMSGNKSVVFWDGRAWKWKQEFE